MAERVVLLHGFSGTHRAWDGVAAALDRERYRPLALDLPGHGRYAPAARPITFAGCIQHVLARSPPERFTLCGYSLGGRVALQVALAAPERLARLVLISCTPGIVDAHERAERRRADEELAVELERAPFEQFIERWRSQPVFAGEPAQAGALARSDQRRNRPDALAAALRGLGTGAMQPLWGRLGELTMPVTVLVGERDEKYRAIGASMVERIAHAELVTLAGGHGLLLENPAGVAGALSTLRLAGPAATQSGSTPSPGALGSAI
jgi:2-succinyl-6-hydroxy-2,4-cyclohexadiene-1-carboxylate synthase